MKVVCPNCDAELPDTYGFCSYCGASLEPRRLLCWECRTSNPATSKFCSECGASLQQAPAPQQIRTSAVAHPQQTAKPRKGKLSDLLVIVGIAALITIGCAIMAILGGQTSPDESDSTNAQGMRQAISTMTIEELKATAEQVPYEELARNTEDYAGKLVHYCGKVVQVVEKSGQRMGLRVHVTEGEYGTWDDLVWVNHEGDRLLEDDVIEFWGEVEGRYSYRTVLGAKVTIPEITTVDLLLLDETINMTSEPLSEGVEVGARTTALVLDGHITIVSVTQRTDAYDYVRATIHVVNDSDMLADSVTIHADCYRNGEMAATEWVYADPVDLNPGQESAGSIPFDKGVQCDEMKARVAVRDFVPVLTPTDTPTPIPSATTKPSPAPI